MFRIVRIFIPTGQPLPLALFPTRAPNQVYLTRGALPPKHTVATMTLDHISVTVTYMMWCEEHLMECQCTPKSTPFQSCLVLQLQRVYACHHSETGTKDLPTTSTLCADERTIFSPHRDLGSVSSSLKTLRSVSSGHDVATYHRRVSILV
jgi:hypothetical protein